VELYKLCSSWYSDRDYSCKLHPGKCPDTCELKSSECKQICGGPCECKPRHVINKKIPAGVLPSDCPKRVTQKLGLKLFNHFK